MQNRSAKNTAPAVSDSFVMHNRTVFVKDGKRQVPQAPRKSILPRNTHMPLGHILRIFS
ncbi:hypothetical protein [Ruminococcus sp.]|uniref:hypothetical protein n=1 Tax=Ruminococcus sp. TaxID=41978 RepID=UPI00265D0D85|nr:hypothetical protein [uncultured Ruminococcus sp.]